MTDQMSNEDLVRQVRQLERELEERDRKVSRLEGELKETRSLYEFASSLTMGRGLQAKTQLIAHKVNEFFTADGSCVALFDEIPGGYRWGR